MSSMTMSQKPFKPIPPDKGAFPLDHDRECRKTMLQYMVCLQKNDNLNAKCRLQAKDYLQCRMDNNLMAKEDWKTLGFGDLVNDDGSLKDATAAAATTSSSASSASSSSADSGKKDL